MTRTTFLFASCSLALPLLLAACGSDDVVEVDAGPVDMGMVDPPDSGVRAKCPLAANNPSCESNTECGGDFTMISGCEGFCPGFKSDICGTGQCSVPETINSNEVITLNVDVGPLIADLNFLVRMAVVAETSGGNTLGCAEVIADPLSFFEDACYNVVDVRAGRANGEVGTVFPLPFSRLPASRGILFVVYGFASDDTTVDPIGISCTEYDVPAAGSAGTEQVGATNMTRIQ